MQTSELKNLFSNILSDQQILTALADLEYYGRDYCKDFAPQAAIVLQPGSLEQIVAIMRVCNQHKIAVVPSGGRTGYSAGATASNGEVVLSLSRLNRIHEVNKVERTLRCDAGVTTEAIQIRAREEGFFFPIDFASRGSSQIGGNVATNAGGIRVIRYGTTRDWVLGLKVVTANGEILELNGSLYKNQTGYDLRSLFVGSEGTLGVIVEVTVKLATQPQDYSLALCGVAALANALPVLSELRAKKFDLGLFEYFDKYCLEKVLKYNNLRSPFADKHEAYIVLEAQCVTNTDRERFEEALVALIESGVISDVVISQSIQQEKELLALRESISETLAKHAFPHKNDVSVPISVLPQFVDELRALFAQQYSNFEVLVFGHIGDGNLHVNILKPEVLAEADFQKLCLAADEKTFTLVQKFHGSISAEHGVGLLKKPFLHFSRSQEEIRLMREIKRVFDANGILNPGKVF